VPELSRRPYLLRAMHEWMVDSGYTPHLIVDANFEAVSVPKQFVKEGRIVLNVSASATEALLIGPEAVEFNARFNGISHYIHVPVDAVLGIYARETGQGMVFTEGVDADPVPPEGNDPGTGAGPKPPSTKPPPPPDKPRRPKLQVVK
jgi:stringent starvation protein B